jgi:O-6-methylguanine DNA methyltransferase
MQTRKVDAMTGRQVQRDILAGRVAAEMRFAQRVWAVCARVPRGCVVTYGDIARALGCPGAARAVGAALGRNPYAPAVPCHRVVGSTGKLTGFAGGLAKKAALLRQEGLTVRGDQVAELARVRTPLGE